MSEKKMLAAIPGLKVAGEKEAQGLSPFELKNALIDYAKKSPKYEQVLNAGRGNPNFYNAPARLALCKLTEFAISISQPYKENKAVRFAPTAPTTKKEKDELYESFKKQFKNDHSEGASFLVEAVDWAIEHLELDRGEFLYEITDAARGDFYPGAPAQKTPPRILANTQKIVEKYLEQILLSKSKSKGSFDLFATEGATAGMVYVFNSLMENFILQKKDKVAVITPVFSPYLEIPALNDYEFDLVFINATQKKEWQIPKKEIEKLKDPHIKALYLINPTNPTSMALSQETLNEIHDVLQENKDLIILVDAVYSTFVDDFKPIIDLAPFNCITVYSFSKYFGVTGWRLGVIMLKEKNIINDKIASVINNNSRKKEALTQRYKIDSETPWNLKFIDRLCLDSREVALGHTAGIATPGQAIMGLFSLYNLLHQETYKPAIQGLLKDRVNDLFDNTDPDKTLPRYSDNPLSTNYYALIDILTLAEKKYTDGKGFAKFLLKTYYPVDFVCQLAYQRASVVLPGYGFFEKENTDENTITPEDHNNWSIRVSLANLDSAAYPKLGRYISELLDLYHDAFTSPA